MKFSKPVNHFFVVTLTSIMLFSSCSGDDEEQQVVEETNTVEGRYVGGWNSNPPTANVYENEPISAIITMSGENEFTGEFFFSNAHVPCCGGDGNNGTIMMSIDGTTITSWSYDDTIPGCPGRFMGSGTIASDGRLLIDFTGSDCEGEHADASLFLRKE